MKPNEILESEHDTEIQKLIKENQTRLFGFILSICPNRLLAEDVLQETNRVIWEKRAVFEINTSFVSWAMRIARNQTLAHIKSSRNKHWLMFNTEFVEEVAKRHEERESIWEGKLNALKPCLQRLSVEELELIQFRYGERYKIDKLAKRSGRTIPATKQMLFRIRKKLKACIEISLRKETSGE